MRERASAVAADAGAERGWATISYNAGRSPCEKAQGRTSPTTVLGSARVRKGWGAIVQGRVAVQREPAVHLAGSGGRSWSPIWSRALGEIAGAKRSQLQPGNGSSCEKAGCGSSYSDAASSCEKGAGVHSRLARK